MIALSAFNASRERATELLISRGFEPVQPVESSFLSHHIHLHLIELRGNYEALCVKLRIANRSVSESYVESFCRTEICQFRSFLTKYPGSVFLRCEVWVVSPNGSIHCYEVLPNSLNEVAAYAGRRDQSGSHDREDGGHSALPDPECDLDPNPETR